MAQQISVCRFSIRLGVMICRKAHMDTKAKYASVLLIPYSSRADSAVAVCNDVSEFLSLSVIRLTPEELIAVMYISSQHIRAAVYVLVPELQFRGCCSPSSSQQIRLLLLIWTPFPLTAFSRGPLVAIVSCKDVRIGGAVGRRRLDNPSLTRS